MTWADRRKLMLEELQQEMTEVESPEHTMLERFLPLSVHVQAMEPRCLAVVGERGAGKSAFFQFLSVLQPHLRSVSPDFRGLLSERKDRKWIQGYSEAGSEHPVAELLVSWAAGATDGQLRCFWLAHLVGLLCEQWLNARPSPLAFWQSWKHKRHEIREWMAPAAQEMAELWACLEVAAKQAARRGLDVVVLYDHLDRLRGPAEGDLAPRLTAQLLQLWSAIQLRHPSLQAKIMVRRDLLEKALHSTTDASKLRHRAVTIEWGREDLLRMVMRRMARRPHLRAWLSGGDPPIPLSEDPPFGWWPPFALPDTTPQLTLFSHISRVVEVRSQTDFMRRLTPPTVRSANVRSPAHHWLFDALADSRGRIVPRQVLTLFGEAARIALEESTVDESSERGERLFTHNHLSKAFARSGEHRLQELREEFPVVEQLQGLKRLDLPLPLAEAEALLSAGWPVAALERGQSVLSALAELGLIVEVDQGPRQRAIDLPETIRLHLEARRPAGRRS